MSDPQAEVGCVVLSLRAEREVLVLTTAAGEVEITAVPVTGTRSKLVIRAPRSVNVSRRKVAANDAV